MKEWVLSLFCCPVTLVWSRPCGVLLNLSETDIWDACANQHWSVLTWGKMQNYVDHAHPWASSAPSHQKWSHADRTRIFSIARWTVWPLTPARFLSALVYYIRFSDGQKFTYTHPVSTRCPYCSSITFPQFIAGLFLFVRPERAGVLRCV